MKQEVKTDGEKLKLELSIDGNAVTVKVVDEEVNIGGAGVIKLISALCKFFDENGFTETEKNFCTFVKLKEEGLIDLTE